MLFQFLLGVFFSGPSRFLEFCSDFRDFVVFIGF